MKLTKSLHTVTATVNVAREMYTRYDTDNRTRAALALRVLGYNIDDIDADDPTLVAILKQIGKL